MSAIDLDEETSKTTNSLIQMELNEKITAKKMRCLVREFGSFPSANRPLVWRCLLQLPHNHSSFRTIALKAIDIDLPENWNSWISKRDQLRPVTVVQLNRALKWLITWSPELSCLDFLPQFVLPFSSILGNDPVSCFEVTVSAIMNWGGLWLEMCSDPPYQLMTLIEELLLKFGPGALKILKQHSISVVSYAWPLLETGFAAVLQEKHWRQLWDHIVCNRPAFYVSVGVAFVCCTETLMRDSTTLSSNFKNMFLTEQDMDMKVLLRKSYEIYDFVTNWPPILICDLTVLPSGAYPTLEQFMENKAEFSKLPTTESKQPKEASGSSMPAETSESLKNDCSNEIMNALMFSYKVRDAVDSWKGARLTGSKEKK